ncbi:MAG: hypothetical protein O7C60_02325, partial [Rickettsia endosymbiont of Ixodes persulcatus]|nr:hypothetical protein [Rickettsia endosymbiont of Ixodes persulcatus]
EAGQDEHSDEHDDDDDNDNEEEEEEISEQLQTVIKASSTLIRLSRLLISRLLILTDSTSPSSSSSSPSTTTSSTTTIPSRFNPGSDSEQSLTSLTSTILKLSELADDLAGNLDDRDFDELRQTVDEIVDSGEEIAGVMGKVFNSTTPTPTPRKDKDGEEKKEEGNGNGKEQEGKKLDWFGVWRGQRDQAKEAILKTTV